MSKKSKKDSIKSKWYVIVIILVFLGVVCGWVSEESKHKYLQQQYSSLEQQYSILEYSYDVIEGSLLIQSDVLRAVFTKRPLDIESKDGVLLLGNRSESLRINDETIKVSIWYTLYNMNEYTVEIITEIKVYSEEENIRDISSPEYLKKGCFQYGYIPIFVSWRPQGFWVDFSVIKLVEGEDTLEVTRNE